MTKFIILNIAAASLYITPIILTKKLCYECTAMDSGVSKQTWMSVANDKEESTNIALNLCQKHSEKPKECVITNCQKKSSGC